MMCFGGESILAQNIDCLRDVPINSIAALGPTERYDPQGQRFHWEDPLLVRAFGGNAAEMAAALILQLQPSQDDEFALG